jgi:prevent-host-death family protein
MTTRTVNTHDAKSQLSELIRAAHAGEEVIVARNGEPVAKIIPWPPARPRRTFGGLAGRVRVPGGTLDDLVNSDDQTTADFEESVSAPASPTFE